MFYTLHNNPTIRFHRKHNLDSRVSFEKRMAQSPVNESNGGPFNCCKRRKSVTAVIPYDEPIATKVQHKRTQIDFLQIKMIEEKILFLQYKSLLLEKRFKDQYLCSSWHGRQHQMSNRYQWYQCPYHHRFEHYRNQHCNQRYHPWSFVRVSRRCVFLQHS